MKKGSHYRRNQSSSSLFEHAQTLEALSKQGNPLEFISEMIKHFSEPTNWGLMSQGTKVGYARALHANFLL